MTPIELGCTRGLGKIANNDAARILARAIETHIATLDEQEAKRRDEARRGVMSLPARLTLRKDAAYASPYANTLPTPKNVRALIAAGALGTVLGAGGMAAVHAAMKRRRKPKQSA